MFFEGIVVFSIELMPVVFCVMLWYQFCKRATFSAYKPARLRQPKYGTGLRHNLEITGW
jgi:hypothetical protein